MKKHHKLPKFKDWFMAMSNDEKSSYAKACGTSRAYIEHLYRGHRTAGHDLAKLMVKNSNGAIALEDIWPDLFG